MKHILLSAVLAMSCLTGAATCYNDGFDEIMQCHFHDNLAYRFTDDSKTALMFADPINYSLIQWDSYTFYSNFYDEYKNMEIRSSVEIDGTEYPVVAIDRDICTAAPIVNLHIPASVKSIGDRAFKHCTDLKKIHFEAGLKSIGESSFNDLEALETLTLPETLNYLGKNSFNKCSSLSSVSLPEGLQHFEGCFNNCENLETVYSAISEPWDINAGWYNFDSATPDTCTLYVPEGKTGEYTAKGWGKYFTIRENGTNIGESAVEEILTPSMPGESATHYFLPSGLEVSADALVPGTLYIRVIGPKAEKIILPRN